MINLPITWSLRVSAPMNMVMMEGMIESNEVDAEKILMLGTVQTILLSKKFKGNVFYSEGAYTGKTYNDFKSVVFYLRFDSPTNLDSFIKFFIKENKRRT